jgi:hypothetical protein
MRTPEYKITLLTLVCFMSLVVSRTAMAQVKTYNEEITVVAPFDPIIPDAFKISSNPAIDDSITSLPVMNYNIMPRLADVRPVIEPLPAVKLVAEPLSKLYRNYIRAGGGNYSALYGELFMSSLRSKKYLTSVHLKHQSSAGKIKDYGPPDNSRNEAEITGTRYFDQHSLTGKAFYYRDGLHLYGFKPSDFPDTIITMDDVKQRYYTAGAAATFGSSYKVADKLNHTIGLSYYHMAGMHESMENNVKINTTLDKRYDLFKLDNDQVLGINAGYNLWNQHNSLGHTNSSILQINPFIKAEINEYSFMAGLKLDVAADTLTTKGHLYPVAEARLELIPDALKLYAGIGGGMERTSLQNITEQNLYISQVMKWDFVNDKFKIYGGFQSNISRSFNFNGSISSSSYENYPFFVTDTSNYLLNTFSLLYDNVSTVKVKGELEFVKSARLRLALNGTYTHYKTNEEYAWYKPAYKFEFTGRYDLQNKIVITAKAVVNGPVWALKPVPESDGAFDVTIINYTLVPEKLKGWADINLGAEYRFTKALSFWLNFNNLTNNKYYRWLSYRSYGINLLGGVSYSF